MIYKLVITQSFQTDLSNILQYISYKLSNPSAAKRLLDNTEKRLSLIKNNPFLHPLYHDEKLAQKGYHYDIVEKYLLFYTIDETTKTVYIARFLYGGQNISNIV